MMTFYTDGSCLTNKDGSFAWIQVERGIVIKEYSLLMDYTSSDRMEMFALLSVLNYLYTNNIRDNTINICSDYKSLVTGFRKFNKKRVHIDIWVNIFLLKKKLSSNTITLNWVKGHSNNKFNVYTDKLCKQSYKK